MLWPEADRLVYAATAEIAAGNVVQAQAFLDQALHLEPGHLMALSKSAEVALFRKDHALALALVDRILSVEPHFAPAWSCRGRAQWLAGDRRHAVTDIARAVDIQPPNAEYRLLLAQVSAWMGEARICTEALAPLLHAGLTSPLDYAGALSVAGEQAVAEGRFEEAESLLAKALSLAPHLTPARMMRGMNLLRLGRYREGWADYAAREQILSLDPHGIGRNLPGEPWNGEDLAGRHLLIADDQGHGDAIQFFRFLPMLKARGAGRITWRTFPALVRLFAAAAPDVSVVDAVPHQDRFDLHCISTALPRLLDTIPATIPAPEAYLRPAYRRGVARTQRAGQRLNVGLAWSGDARHTRDHLRSIAAAQFLRLADLPGINFHSLQHVVRPQDMPALLQRAAIRRDVEQTTDFADTAALIDRLDLVIAVDTGVAHLAAALGKPVWIILHVASDWRWMTVRHDSPWYSTVRLFRVAPEEWPNPADGGWDPVLDRVAAALRQHAAG